MATPAQMAQDLQRYVTNLQQLLSNHQLCRGTFEAVLAEAQGGEFVLSNAETAEHVTSLEQAARGLMNNESQLTDLLRQIRSVDPRTAGQLSQSLQPILQMARQRIALVEETRQVVFELKMLHPDKLASVPLQTGPREIASMASTQLQNLRMSLVPSGVSSAPWVQEVLEEIEELPVNEKEAAAAASAAAAAGRSMITAMLRQAAAGASSSLLRILGSALEALWTIGGTLISIPLIIVDQNGNPIGMSRGRNDMI
jgi:hypothetical protein